MPEASAGEWHLVASQYYHSSGHHAELHHTNPIVDILKLPKFWLHCYDSHRAHTLNNTILSKEPACEIDVVDIAIDEDATRELFVRDEEPGWV